MMRSRKSFRYHPVILITLCAILLILAGCQKPYEFNGFVYEDPQQAAEIIGTNWDGERFRLSDQQGKVSVIFFGYTFCPDICPMTLANMAQLYEALEQEAEDISVIFVSADPDRDSPEQLASYIPQFNDSFFGVHIPTESLEETKKGYGVFSEKRFVDGDENSDNYFVDHTGAVYVIDKAGLLRLLHKFDSTVEEMLPDIQHLINN